MKQIEIRRRYTKNGLLLSNYKLAEYVENTSNICLFTDIPSTSELEMRIDYEMAASQPDSYSSLTHVRNGYNTPVLTLGHEGSATTRLIRFGKKTYSMTLDGERHVVEWSGKMVYLDGMQVIDGSTEEFGSSEYGSINRSIPLFGGRTNNGNNTGKYSRCKIYMLTINKHDFIPCYGIKEQSWGLYDTFAKRFLFNKTALTGKLL